LREAVKDLGWLPIALMGLGGLSINDILEKAIIQRDLNLAAPFEIVLQSYQRIIALLHHATDIVGERAVIRCTMGDEGDYRRGLIGPARTFASCIR
jgi:hypothetical protein